MKSILDKEETAFAEKYDTIFYNYKLAQECSRSFVSDIVDNYLQNEFSGYIKDVDYYEVLKQILIDKLCTMQSIKNVLSYKKENGIKEIHDVNFNNGEVELTCLV